jgi:hypothetical protein
MWEKSYLKVRKTQIWSKAKILSEKIVKLVIIFQLVFEGGFLRRNQMLIQICVKTKFSFRKCHVVKVSNR